MHWRGSPRPSRCRRSGRHRAGSITPTPPGDGQMSALISFIIHAWCPGPPKGGLAATTTSTHSWKLSRQCAQPRSDASTKRHGHVPVRRVVVEAVGVGPDGVLEHRRPHVVPVDDVEVLGLVELAGFGIDCLENQRVLVVGHRLGRVDVTVDQRRHVEGLLHQGDVAIGIETIGPQTGEELELVAEAPVADVGPCEIIDGCDTGVSEGHLERATALEHLSDVGDVQALLAGHEATRHPRDGEVGATGVENRCRHDVDAAVEDGDIEADVLVEPEVARRRSTRRTGTAEPTGAGERPTSSPLPRRRPRPARPQAPRPVLRPARPPAPQPFRRRPFLHLRRHRFRRPQPTWLWPGAWRVLAIVGSLVSWSPS